MGAEQIAKAIVVQVAARAVIGPRMQVSEIYSARGRSHQRGARARC